MGDILSWHGMGEKSVGTGCIAEISFIDIYA